jgi:replicative DNA helicase
MLQTITKPNTNGHHKNGNGHHGDVGKIQIADSIGNDEAEINTLGCLLINQDAIIEVSLILRPSDFELTQHQRIYSTMLELYRQGRPHGDVVVLSDELDKKGWLESLGGGIGPVYLTDLINMTVWSVMGKYYAEIVKEYSRKRAIMRAACELAKLAHEKSKSAREATDEAQRIIFGLSQDGTDGALSPILAGVNNFLDMTEQRQERRRLGLSAGISTGIKDLDKMIGGLMSPDLVILAGRPGMGKTSMALSIALDATRKQKQRVGVFSLEMSDAQLVQRLVSAITKIDSTKMRDGLLTEAELPVIIDAASRLSSLPIFVDDTPAITITDMYAKTHQLIATHGIDLLIVDYLQLMRGESSRVDRRLQIVEITRRLKQMAREFKIPILALSQLSRGVENRHDKRPLLSDLKESGSIEEDADIVLFMYRDFYYNKETRYPNVAEIHIGKNRHGPGGMVGAYFNSELAQFVPLTGKEAGV